MKSSKEKTQTEYEWEWLAEQWKYQAELYETQKKQSTETYYAGEERKIHL